MDRAAGSISHPPYFDGENYGAWKAKMKAFLWSLDACVWNTVVFGYSPPTKTIIHKSKKISEEGKADSDVVAEEVVLKPHEEWTLADQTHSMNNQKGLNALFTALSPDQFSNISNCETSKEAWDILQVTYEGTNAVKESKLQRYVTQFEIIRMEEDETFSDFYAKLNSIVNACANLGDKIPESRVVKKVLRSLPSRFQPKKTAIEEVRDLNTMKIAELVGSLKTYEMELPTVKRSKNIALKAVKEECEESEEIGDEEFALITRQFQKFLKSKNFKGKGTSSGSKSFKSNNFNSEKGSRLIKQTEGRKCYECQGFGHEAKECANTLKKLKSEKNKAMKSTWSDSESDSDSEGEIVAFVGFANINDLEESDSQELDAEEILQKYNELYHVSVKIRKHSSDMKEKLKNLETEKSRIETVFQSRLSELEKENKSLTSQLEASKEKIIRLTIGAEKIDKMLSIGKSSGDKTGLGFDGSTDSSLRTKFVKASGTCAMPKTCVLTCHACGEVGHIRPHCDKKYLNHSDNFSVGTARTHLSNLLREVNRLSKLVHIPNSHLPKMKLVWREKKGTKLVNESHCCLLAHSSIESNDLKCFVAFTALDSCNSNKWYFDSGCSRHMTGDKRWFQSFSDKKVRGTVTFGDGKKAKVLGEGTVKAPGLPALHNVLLVESLTANLMSISQLCDVFGKAIFDEIECIVSTKTGEKVICGPRSDDNCYCAMANGLNVCYRVENNITNLWHRRLGHMNFRDLIKISKKEYVRGLPTLSGKQEGVCGDCQIGKQTKSSHSPTNFSSTSKPLELMHMDLVGPMQTLSLGGKKYILVLVDDFTRFTWVAFLHDKSEAFKSFTVLCMKIQNEKHDNIIRLRTDHGTEFENHFFSEFCDEHGIAHEFSAPITPQQNGVVERKNRVLLDMSRVMLNSANLAKHFWAEAICSACYTANRVYLRPKSKATPYELWKGKKPNVSHLRVFGSTCYIYKDREHLAKFDSRSDIGGSNYNAPQSSTQ
ncbi:uncharacterized protein [Malus domestica]|uniref:uncharacterized protein n=1 Tax=Malus domestica TaxID=3750 RepID=UPI0039761323